MRVAPEEEDLCDLKSPSQGSKTVLLGSDGIDVNSTTPSIGTNLGTPVDPWPGDPAFDPFAPRSDRLVKEDLMNERMDHILDQLGFLLKEEVILQEMHLISDERERLYGISRRLFLG